MLKLLKATVVMLTGVLLAGCSATRHVPEGSRLLTSSTITIEGEADGIDRTALQNYLRQQPNQRVLGFAKLSLGIYNMSGRDSTRWYNRWLRNLGQPPVIHSSALTEQSRRQLQLAMVNRGYNDARVTVDSVTNRDKRISLNYKIDPGEPFYVETFNYTFDDPAIGEIIMADTLATDIPLGTLLDRNLLDEHRSALTRRLRDRGYYAFNKEFITFIADTVAGSKGVELTMHVNRPDVTPADSIGQHRRYIVRKVIYRLDDAEADREVKLDTIDRGNVEIIYGKDRYLSPSILDDLCYIVPGEPYNATTVDRTYEALSRLGILRYVNIAMRPVGVTGDVAWLDAVITLSRTKKQSITFELDGTNSEGDLGFGVGVIYQHRNLAHGSQLLTAKFRAAYESISGNVEGLINDRYSEYSAEVGITFPKFEAPFLSKSFKQKVTARTEFTVSFNYQERPEYTRIISGLAWKYKWDNRFNTVRHTYDFIDLNYVKLPRSTIDFINTIAPTNPLLRYSYEDHLIMRMGYSLYRTNRRQTSRDLFAQSSFQRDIWVVRASVETAGNFLYALSKAVGLHRHGGAYKIFDTQFAQYAKAEADYSYSHAFTRRQSIALHAGVGIGVPYGNSSMIPFEKRFYAGGANSVRGWGVRTLGPGSYDSKNSVTDFINQCGDIRLDLSVEYRAKLFWVVEGALFIDAGNIWTIRNYENQPGGWFRFNKFYKEIAAAYGAGLRFDFSYFLLRLDLGLKAHNPAMGQEPWPLIHPNWHRDATFHFSIGYPF